MARVIKITQGDTSPIWNFTVEIGGKTQTLDSKWSGTIHVKRAISTSAEALFSSALTVSNNTFIAYLEPDDTSKLEIGEYYIVIEITNSSIVPKFNRETYIDIEVTKQAIG